MPWITHQGRSRPGHEGLRIRPAQRRWRRRDQRPRGRESGQHQRSNLHPRRRPGPRPGEEEEVSLRSLREVSQGQGGRDLLRLQRRRLQPDLMSEGFPQVSTSLSGLRLTSLIRHRPGPTTCCPRKAVSSRSPASNWPLHCQFLLPGQLALSNLNSHKFSL